MKTLDFSETIAASGLKQMDLMKIQANFDISNSKGMGKTLRVFRSSR